MFEAAGARTSGEACENRGGHLTHLAAELSGPSLQLSRVTEQVIKYKNSFSFMSLTGLSPPQSNTFGMKQKANHHPTTAGPH